MLNLKSFEDFLNESISYEEEKNREILIDIVKRYSKSSLFADITLLYFGLYKKENGEYVDSLTPIEISEYFKRNHNKDFPVYAINKAISLNIKQLKDIFVKQKYKNEHIGKKDRDVLYDLLSTISDKDMDVSDEDIEDLRKGNIEEMKSLKDVLYYEEMVELKSILAKIDKSNPEDYEEESFGIMVNIRTHSRYRIFIDKDKADDFVAEDEDALSDVMDYPYKYNGYKKHFYIVLLDPNE